MAVLTSRQHGVPPALTVLLRLSVVGLTLATAAIHASLGGTLFLLNAIGYVVFAIALALPRPIATFHWLIRYGLIGFTATTIGAWVAFGARFDLAYLDKGLEVVLIGVLLIEIWVVDGGPLVAVRRVRRLAGSILR